MLHIHKSIYNTTRTFLDKILTVPLVGIVVVLPVRLSPVWNTLHNRNTHRKKVSGTAKMTHGPNSVSSLGCAGVLRTGAVPVEDDWMSAVYVLGI